MQTEISDEQEELQSMAAHAADARTHLLKLSHLADTLGNGRVHQQTLHALTALTDVQQILVGDGSVGCDAPLTDTDLDKLTGLFGAEV